MRTEAEIKKQINFLKIYVGKNINEMPESLDKQIQQTARLNQMLALQWALQESEEE